MKIGFRLLACLCVLATASCIPYPGEAPDDGRGSSLPSLATNVFPGLDAGANEQQSLHFKVHAYGSQNAQEISDMAEAAYTRIMNDTGLYSFQPHGLYEITVYGSQDEYRKKTGQQDWSAGVTAGGNAIYVFYSSYASGVISHEITHLIWFEFMNGRLSDQTRWANEGLAVYEEAKTRNRGQELFSSFLPTLRASPIPMDQLQNLAPSNENGYSVSLWYAQAESMIRFMIEKGGRIGFGQFLNAIRDGQGFDAAIYAGFPGQWRTLVDFENDWKRSLL
jgi:hypothetical protein